MRNYRLALLVFCVSARMLYLEPSTHADESQSPFLRDDKIIGWYGDLKFEEVNKASLAIAEKCSCKLVVERKPAGNEVGYYDELYLVIKNLSREPITICTRNPNLFRGSGTYTLFRVTDVQVEDLCEPTEAEMLSPFYKIGVSDGDVDTKDYFHQLPSYGEHRIQMSSSLKHTANYRLNKQNKKPVALYVALFPGFFSVLPDKPLMADQIIRAPEALARYLKYWRITEWRNSYAGNKFAVAKSNFIEVKP